MSGALAQPLPHGAGSSRPLPATAEAAARDTLPLRLACFTALAAFGAGHWTGLVADAPVGRVLLEVAVVTAGAAALGLLGRARLPRAAVLALAWLTTLAMFVAALGAAGLSLRLLGPRGWDELADGLTRGLEGVQTVDWPYAGPDEWIRLTILLGAPALMAAAAALAFFPVRSGGRVLRLGGPGAPAGAVRHRRDGARSRRSGAARASCCCCWWGPGSGCPG